MRGWRMRTLLASLALLLLATCWLGMAMLLGQWRQAPRLDLTTHHLYTLSSGMERIIGDVDEPIQLTLYFSRHATRDLPALRSYANRVQDMLAEIRTRSHGRINIREVDPVPYSDDEDRALGAGLTAVPGGSNGERVFFGLAGRADDGKQRSIPFFDPREERTLEYSIAKLLHELTLENKPRVDVISSLPIAGEGIGDLKPWAISDQLQQLFDVHMRSAAKIDHVDDDVRALVVIHPQDLPTDALFAIDQYVLGGGHLLVFTDPDARTAIQSVGSLTRGGSRSSLPRLFRAWGVQFDPDKVVLDRSRALSVSSKNNTQPVRHPAMLGLTQSDLNQHQAVTRDLQLVDLATAGYFELAPDTDSRLAPLMQTTSDAMVVPAGQVRGDATPTDLLSDYHPDGEHYAVATLLRGQFRTAFPERVGSDDLSQADGEREVALVADTDLLSDRMWVQPTPYLGEKMLSAFADNATFVTNLLDYLTGPSALLAVPAGANSRRPFTRIRRMRRTADQRFRQRKRKLENELTATEKRLSRLQPGKIRDGDNNSNTRKQIDRSIQHKRDVREQLRKVQHRLDTEIDALERTLKFADILLVPLILVFIGVGYGSWRAGRTRRKRSAQP